MAQQTFSKIDVPKINGQIQLDEATKTADFTTAVANATGYGKVEIQIIVTDFDNSAHDATLDVSVLTDRVATFGSEVTALKFSQETGSASYGTSIFKAEFTSLGYARVKFAFGNLSGLTSKLTVFWQIVG